MAKLKANILFRENFRIAIDSIKSNRLRTVLTILIIAFGIMALVGILTAIESIKSSLNSNFTSLGANTFRITSWKMMGHQPGEDRVEYKDIDYREATSFKKRFSFPATVSISTRASSVATAKYLSKKTNPNIAVFGIDENYFSVSGYEIEKGRNFSPTEVQQGTFSIVIGQELVNNLFGKKVDPVGQFMMLGGSRYKVVGTIKSKGSSMGGAGDKICFIPLMNSRQNFSSEGQNFTINIIPLKSSLLDISISEAEGIFRMVRRLKLNEPNNFEISKSDSLANMLMENISYVTIAATLIGIITLLGASIGLMNIMLVSVTERTKEIGTRKALGANSSVIKQQFLFEAIFIGQLGGVFGIIFGIIAGNLISLLTDGPFVVPWIWILFGVVLCFIVGLVSGLIPAIKASRLDPINALRHE